MMVRGKSCFPRLSQTTRPSLPAICGSVGTTEPQIKVDYALATVPSKLQL